MENRGNGCSAILVLVLVIGAALVFLTGGGAGLLGGKLLSAPTPVPAMLQVDPGIVMVPANIRGVVGPGNVYVHVSPEGTPNRTASATDETGARHYWVPGSLPPTLATLNLEEGQEYLLRRLVECPGCDFDASGEKLDPRQIRAMAADKNIQRIDAPSDILQTYAFTNFAEKALEEQRKTSDKGFDSIVKIIGMERATDVGVEVAHGIQQWGQTILVIGLVVAFLYFTTRGGKGRSRRDDYDGY